MLNKKIIKLLALCLKAKEQGYNVFYEYAPHVNAVSIYKYKDEAKFVEGEQRTRVFSYTIYTDMDSVAMLHRIDEATNSVEKLLNNSNKENA